MEIGLKVKLVNHNLYDAITSKYKNVARFCKAKGFCPTHIGEFVNLKRLPSIEIVQRLEKALHLPFEYLFPEDLCKQVKQTVHNSFYFHKEIECIPFNDIPLKELTYNPINNIEKDDVKEIISRELDKLSPHEKSIIVEKYGLNGGGEKTLKETGKLFSVSGDRIMQIEMRALRKLRDSRKFKALKEANM